MKQPCLDVRYMPRSGLFESDSFNDVKCVFELFLVFAREANYHVGSQRDIISLKCP